MAATEWPLVDSSARRNRSCPIFAEEKCICHSRLKGDGVPSMWAQGGGERRQWLLVRTGEEVSLSPYAVKSCAPLASVPAIGPLKRRTKTVQTLPLPWAIPCRNVQVERRSELSPRSWQRHLTVYLQIPPSCKISMLRSLSWYNLSCNIYSLLHEIVNFKWKHAENMQFIYFNVPPVCYYNENVYKCIKYISFIAISANILVCFYICIHSRQNI